MRSKLFKNNLSFFLFLILLLGIVRFIYATSFKENVSLFDRSYAEKSVNRTIKYSNENIEFNRAWGPVSVALIKGINFFFPKDYTTFVLRICLFICYGIIIFFLINLLLEFRLIFTKDNTFLWGLVLIFFSFQSSSVISNITNGGAEVFTSLSIIGHFYFFYKKKYFLSSIFIIIGVYLKLHPIIFGFPYFVFSIFSKNHRSYIFYLFLIASFVALISYLIQGIKYGALYPLSIIFSVIEQSTNTIPIWSQEIFNPLSLINKLINGFQIVKSYSHPPPIATSKYEISSLVRSIVTIFSLLLFVSNFFAGYILSKSEYKWTNDNQLRLIYLFFFQVVIGFLYLFLSLDISIEHLLNAILSIYAPIFLFSITVHKINDSKYIKIIFFLFYIIGLILIGGILPISVVNTIIPYDFFDKIVGDNTQYVGQPGRFIWYHIPLVGLFIIASVCFFYTKYILNKK